MTPPKISVIIPIYDVEEYIDRCLTSVRNQTLHDIEIICVDDCSPDQSYKIVQRHAFEDSRIQLVRHTNNLGLGGARNTAIRIAKGEYIASVDSDDYMLPNMLERLWNETENSWYDVVCCGFNRVDEKGNIIQFQKYPAKILINDDNDINIFSALNPAFWNKLWRTSLFTDNNIFFPVHMYFEDMPITPSLLSKARYIKVIEDRLYQYFIRQASITTSYSPKHIIDYFNGFELLLKFLDENQLTKHYQKEFIAYVNSNLRFHSDNLVGSGMRKSDLEQYLRNMLLLKIGFLENREILKTKNLGELLEWLKKPKISSALEEYKVLLEAKIKQNDASQSELLKCQTVLNTKDLEVRQLKEILDTKNLEAINLQKLLDSRDQKIHQYMLVFEAKERELDEIKDTSKIEIQQLFDKNNKYKSVLDQLEVKLQSMQVEMSILTSRQKEYEAEKERKISCYQGMVVLLFGLFIRPTCTKQQYEKLKQNPKLFFKDSKSRFTRKVGNILGF